jgi:hypothetical protein
MQSGNQSPFCKGEVMDEKRQTAKRQNGKTAKRLRNGWIKRQVTLVVSHKARP